MHSGPKQVQLQAAVGNWFGGRFSFWIRLHVWLQSSHMSWVRSASGSSNLISKDAPQSRTVDSAVDRTIPVHIPGRPKYIKIFYTAPFVVIGMLNNCIEWFGVPMLRRKPAILSSHLTISKFAIDLITKTHWSEHVHTSCLSACASPQHLLNRQNASWHSNTTNSTLFKKCMCKSTFAMHMRSIEKLSRNANRNSNRKPESPRTE